MGAWLSSILGGSKGDGKTAKKVQEFDDIGAGVGGDVDQEDAAARDAPIRVPGIIPFTTMIAEPSLADVLYDDALVRGWLSCIDKVKKKRRERWCAVHENYLYEFEPVQSEMLQRAKHSLEGSICWVPEGSKDTFILHVGGMFHSVDRNSGENEISYTVDDPATLKEWVDGITVSSVLEMMGRIGGVPALIQERQDVKLKEERDRELKEQRRAERRQARREAKERDGVSVSGAASVSSAVGTQRTGASTHAASVAGTRTSVAATHTSTASHAKAQARAGAKAAARAGKWGKEPGREGAREKRAGGDARGETQGAEGPGEGGAGGGRGQTASGRSGGAARKESVAEADVVAVAAPQSLLPGAEAAGGAGGAEEAGGAGGRRAGAEGERRSVMMEPERSLGLPAPARELARAGLEGKGVLEGKGGLEGKEALEGKGGFPLKPPAPLAPADGWKADSGGAGAEVGDKSKPTTTTTTTTTTTQEEEEEEEEEEEDGTGGSSRDDSGAVTEERALTSAAHSASAAHSPPHSPHHSTTHSVASSESERKVRVERVRVVALEEARGEGRESREHEERGEQGQEEEGEERTQRWLEEHGRRAEEEEEGGMERVRGEGGEESAVDADAE